ncbi:MAG: hypothetical protein RPU13_07570 [Candidatus Sedimenticola sp. (ex Thyasira tokunagai)]
MTVNISITLTAVLDAHPEFVEAIADLSSCGNAEGLATLGDYTRAVGVSDADITNFMASVGASDRLYIVPPLDDEAGVTIESLKPIILQAFAKLQTGVLTCIHMTEGDFQILTRQPEWIAAQPPNEI